MKKGNFLLWLVLVGIMANGVSAGEICQYASYARATSQNFGSLAVYALGEPDAPKAGECNGYENWSGYGYSWAPGYWFVKANLTLGYEKAVYVNDFTIFGDYDICWKRMWLRNSATGQEMLVFDGFDESCISKIGIDGDFLADTIILETCGWSWSSTDAVELCGNEVICGNGILEQGEDCDDGNNEDGDGCSSDCSKEDLCCDVDCSYLDDECNYGECDSSCGECKKIPRNDGISCYDNNACTENDVCSDGVCRGIEVNCDDGVECTMDRCDLDTGCINTPDDSLCDDKLYCNGLEYCDGELDCQAGTAPNCDDNTACTVDSCNEDTDSCNNVAADSLCDDGLYCNGFETCDAKLDCKAGTAPDCNDGVGCTDDSCDEDKDKCVNAANDANCDNRLWCDGAEYCDIADDCQKEAAPDCEDKNICTEDRCDEELDRCVYSEILICCIVDDDCDDLNACTEDVCIDNRCQNSEIRCDDGIECTIDSCEIETGCVNTPDNGLCDDKLYCNGEEYCDIGLGCQPGLPVECSDIEFCTVNEHCDEEFDTCVVEARDCSDKNIEEIATCDNDTDSNIFTWDYREEFISKCDEANDKCPEGSTEISHECDIDRCNADCEDICWDYCEGDILYYNGVCNDCVCERLTRDCSEDDGWYDSGGRQWIKDQECTEKEQKLEEYRDYSCGHADCAYEAKEDRWVDTGETRNIEDGTSCDDGNLCTENDACLDGECGGAENDCLAYDISGIAECFYSPDEISFTWDYREEFISECNEATGECIEGDTTITHECNINNCNAECIEDYDCPEKCTKTSHKLYDFDGCIDCECDYSNPHCVVGECGAECDKDSDCSCEQDYCDGTAFIDYPEYGRCGTAGEEGCLCQTDSEEECKPIIDYCNLDCGAECSGESDCDYGEVCDYGTCSCVCSPMEEVCDGRDNDCDGLIDEGEETELIIESTTEDDEQVYLDGNWLSSNWVWDEKTVNNVVLETGKHVLALRLKNWGWYPGFIVSVFHHYDEVLFNTQEDGTWLYSTDCSGDWTKPGFDDNSWEPLESVGFFGSPHWGYRPDDWRDYSAKWLWASSYTEICVRKRFEIFTYLEEECGENNCKGYRLCIDGKYGDCSSQYDDCSVCCECDEDGIETYDSHQDDDCMPTICPESGCGYGDCAQYSLFPDEVENECVSLYECSGYECEAECLEEDISTDKLSFRAEGGNIVYIGDDSEFSFTDVDLSGWFAKVFYKYHVDGVTSLEVTAKTKEGKRVILNVRMDLNWAIVGCDEIYGKMTGRGTYYKQGKGREMVDCEAEYWIDRISERVDIQGSCNGIDFRIEDINNLKFV